MRSPLATVTLSLACPQSLIVVHYAATVSIKLWVEPESNSAVRRVPLTRTMSCMVHPTYG
jgi:hypothetical protein